MSKVIFLKDRMGENNMLIGEILEERMKCLGINIDELSEKSLIDKEVLIEIINNERTIDELELDFISQVLYCTQDYFKDSDIRKKDVLNCALNRGNSDVKSNIVKVKLQQFASDFEFLMTIYKETESGV